MWTNIKSHTSNEDKHTKCNIHFYYTRVQKENYSTGHNFSTHLNYTVKKWVACYTYIIAAFFLVVLWTIPHRYGAVEAVRRFSHAWSLSAGQVNYLWEGKNIYNVNYYSTILVRY